MQEKQNGRQLLSQELKNKIAEFDFDSLEAKSVAHLLSELQRKEDTIQILQKRLRQSGKKLRWNRKNCERAFKVAAEERQEKKYVQGHLSEKEEYIERLAHKIIYLSDGFNSLSPENNIMLHVMLGKKRFAALKKELTQDKECDTITTEKEKLTDENENRS